MSHVASLENCKRLYELSGWDDTETHHVVMNENYIATTDSTPAYDAGYLLIKLPGHIALTSTNWDDVYTEKPEGQTLDYQACACYQSNIRRELVQEVADTPEDALCLLAIRLFEQGILKREEA